MADPTPADIEMSSATDPLPQTNGLSSTTPTTTTALDPAPAPVPAPTSNTTTPAPRPASQPPAPAIQQPPERPAAHGSPTRVYLNQNVTPHLLEGMKYIAAYEPEKPLRWLSEFLAKKSAEVEGQ